MIDRHHAAMLAADIDTAIYLNDKEQGRIAAEYWMDLGAKRTELTNAVKAFAHDEFQ